ncbi:MAG: 3-deoxy-D-manno-octulosonic acid transferase [Bacteroidales bacterium]|jgi:3-deoxy-D-manno-octulosonic-acid transferase|nr:3-deoxy-D-manno-octulosonic acid transferase [Bacteroidales bacterium]
MGNAKARLLLEGQRDVWKQIDMQLVHGEQRIWIHCASTGEFEQGRPLIEALREKYPQYKLVATFFSPSGYELRKNSASTDYVFYLPYDTRRNAKRFIALVQPVKAYFIKYEFWRNYLLEIHRRRIPLYLVSANFRGGQIFFKRYGSPYKQLLRYFTWFFVQNERSRNLLVHTGFNNVTVTGDTRFDRVCRIAEQGQPLPVVERFAAGKKCVVAGSTWQPDVDMLLRYLHNGKHSLKWIIAPHELHESQIEQLITEANKKDLRAIRYSQTTGKNPSDYDVLVIDNIGMLSLLYRYGTIAYIGGGFGKGIHNILEAAVYGLPVFFGPAYGKFQEAIDLVACGGAFPIHDYAEFARKIDELLDNEEQLLRACETAKTFVASGRGATAKVIDGSMQ